MIAKVQHRTFGGHKLCQNHSRNKCFLGEKGLDILIFAGIKKWDKKSVLQLSLIWRNQFYGRINLPSKS